MGLISSIVNSVSQNYWADKNFKLQLENLEYQKDLQQQIFQREDSAVRRRVEDLRKAGLSPLLASGDGAGAGSVVSTSAPQRQNVKAIEDAQLLQNLGTMASIDRTKADKAYTDSLREGLELKNKFYREHPEIPYNMFESADGVFGGVAKMIYDWASDPNRNTSKVPKAFQWLIDLIPNTGGVDESRAIPLPYRAQRLIEEPYMNGRTKAELNRRYWLWNSPYSSYYPKYRDYFQVGSVRRGQTYGR